LPPETKGFQGDKLAKYKGTAQVLVAQLEFPYPCYQVNGKIVEQLNRDFEGEGRIKENSTNRIPAIIDNSILQPGLEELAASAETFEVRMPSWTIEGSNDAIRIDDRPKVQSPSLQPAREVWSLKSHNKMGAPG
jgi:hypothetical protein